MNIERNKTTMFSKEEMKKFNNTFESDEDVIELSKQRDFYFKTHQFQKWEHTRNKINSLYNNILTRTEKAPEEEAIKAELLTKLLEPEELEQLAILTDASIFLCDLIEDFTGDINCILKKVDKDSRIIMFEKLAALGKEAKKQMKYMQGATRDEYKHNFGLIADNMKPLIINKVKAFHRKFKDEKKTK